MHRKKTVTSKADCRINHTNVSPKICNLVEHGIFESVSQREKAFSIIKLIVATKLVHSTALCSSKQATVTLTQFAYTTLVENTYSLVANNLTQFIMKKAYIITLICDGFEIKMPYIFNQKNAYLYGEYTFRMGNCDCYRVEEAINMNDARFYRLIR